MKRIHKIFLLTFFLGVPSLAFAAETIGQLIYRILGDIANPLIAVTVALAVLYFFYGIAELIANAGNQAKRDEGKQKMIWGVIGLFVIFSVWGFVKILQETVFTDVPADIFERQ